jgi:hypothetical protein
MFWLYEQSDRRYATTRIKTQKGQSVRTALSMMRAENKKNTQQHQ